MSWQILLGISILTYVISQILQRVLLKEESTDPLAFAIVFQLFVGVVIGVYAMIKGFSFPANVYSLLPHLFLTLVLYGVGNIFLFKSLKAIPISEFTILFSTSTLWTIVGAVIFLHEKFLLPHILGTLLILTSLFFVFKPSSKMKISRGHIHSLIAAGLFGFAFVNDAFVLKTFEVNSYVSLGFILPAIGLLVVYPRSIKNIIVLLKPDNLKKLSITVLFYAVSAITIFTAYIEGHNSAVISVVGKTSSILIVLAGIVFLGERDNTVRKIIGACIATVGVILLVL
jgi:drug/metabolite transporter (DMT)-like permease